MKLHNLPTDTGTCFAWTPKVTPDGVVWLEWVHYRRVTCAYDIDPWRYQRMIPEKQYAAGERAQAKFFDYEMVNGRVVPPNVSKCAERNTNDPCRYPQCTCMNLGGSTCPT